MLFTAGSAACLLLGALLPAVSCGLPGALALGGLGGVIIGLLKDHITGAHHHMAGHDLAGMGMTPANGPPVMLTTVLWGSGGGAALLILAWLIGRLVPGK